MILYLLEEQLRHLRYQILLVYHVEGVVGGDAVHYPPDASYVGSRHSGVGCEDLHPGVRVPRMGVHYPAGELHHLPQIGYQDDVDLEFDGVVQHLPDEVAAFDREIGIDAVDPFREVLPVVAGNHQQGPVPVRRTHVHLGADGVDERGLAHRLDDPAGSEDGYPSLDPQAGVERLLGDLDSFRNGYHRPQPAGVSQ